MVNFCHRYASVHTLLSDVGFQKKKKLITKPFVQGKIRSTLERGSNIDFLWKDISKGTDVEVGMMPSQERDKHLLLRV